MLWTTLLQAGTGAAMLRVAAWLASARVKITGDDDLMAKKTEGEFYVWLAILAAMFTAAGSFMLVAGVVALAELM